MRHANKKKACECWIVRGITLLAVIAIAVLMFIIGRGHTIYFDNKAPEAGGEGIEVPYNMDGVILNLPAMLAGRREQLRISHPDVVSTKFCLAKDRKSSYLTGISCPF